MRLEDDNGSALIKQLESKRGGEISWKSYSIFYADSDGKIIENGVFVYKIGDLFWLEDFEKAPSIFGMKISNPKNYHYEKFERCFAENDILSSQTVLKKDAIKYIEHRIDSIKPVGKLAAFFGEPITMVTLKDNKKLFLHLLDSSILKK